MSFHPLPLSGLSPDPARVDLWLMSPDALTERQRQACLSVLNVEERARHDRYRAPSAQAQFLVARALLRTVLSRYAPLPPQAWHFDTNTYGKPRVADALRIAGLHFNVSHTDGLVALAVSGRPDLGLDVEHTGRAMGPLQDLIDRHFAPGERALVAGVADPAAQAQLFFEVWTLKESYIKARGLGLSLALDSFDLEVPADDADGRGVRLTCLAACGDDGARWQFHRLRPTARHTLALACAAPASQRLALVTHWVPEVVPA